MKVHLRTRQTGDAAVAVAELGPEGMFDAGKEYGWLRRSAAVEELWNATLLELRTLAHNFIPDADFDKPPNEEKRALWQRRYETAVEQIRRAEITTSKAGAENYIALVVSGTGILLCSLLILPSRWTRSTRRWQR